MIMKFSRLPLMLLSLLMSAAAVSGVQAATATSNVTITATFVYPPCSITVDKTSVPLGTIDIGTDIDYTGGNITLSTSCQFADQTSQVYATVITGTVNGTTVNMAKTADSTASGALLSLKAVGGNSAGEVIAYSPITPFCAVTSNGAVAPATRDCVLTPHVDARSTTPGAVQAVMTFTVVNS